MKKFLINLSKKYKPLGTVLRHARIALRKMNYYRYKRKYDIDEHMVVFSSFTGRKYSDNPKALYLKMQNDRKYKDYKFIWMFNNTKEYEDYFKDKKNTILVKDRSKEAYKYYASAKYIIVNAILYEEITPKKEQIFVECWHGTPLKRLRCDIKHDSNLLKTKREIKTTNDIDIKRYNYFISPSKFASEKFISAFNLKELGKEDIIIETGYPRNDGLFYNNSIKIKELKKELNIPSNKKVILYAPTFRDNNHDSNIGYKMDLALDLEKMKKELSKDYVILFRTHYYIANKIDLKKYKNFVYDVSDYYDINDLYLVSDLLITDYSSVFFDYANLKKPILFYMYDLEEYKNEIRDFYLDLKELPGPILENEDDLIKNIKNINMFFDLYNEKYKKFNRKFNYLDSSDSSKKVLDIIIKED